MYKLFKMTLTFIKPLFLYLDEFATPQKIQICSLDCKKTFLASKLVATKYLVTKLYL